MFAQSTVARTALEEASGILEYLRKEGRDRVLMSGWAEKQPIDHTTFNKRWRRKWFELHPHAVIWFNEPDAIPRGYLLLSHASTVHEHWGKGAWIELTSSGGRTLRVRLRSAPEHNAWFEAISAALLKQREASLSGGGASNRRGSVPLAEKKKGLAAAGSRNQSSHLPPHSAGGASADAGNDSDHRSCGAAGSSAEHRSCGPSSEMPEQHTQWRSADSEGFVGRPSFPPPPAPRISSSTTPPASGSSSGTASPKVRTKSLSFPSPPDFTSPGRPHASSAACVPSSSFLMHSSSKDSSTTAPWEHSSHGSSTVDSVLRGHQSRNSSVSSERQPSVADVPEEWSESSSESGDELVQSTSQVTVNSATGGQQEEEDNSLLGSSLRQSEALAKVRHEKETLAQIVKFWQKISGVKPRIAGVENDPVKRWAEKQKEKREQEAMIHKFATVWMEKTNSVKRRTVTEATPWLACSRGEVRGRVVSSGSSTLPGGSGNPAPSCAANSGVTKTGRAPPAPPRPPPPPPRPENRSQSCERLSLSAASEPSELLDVLRERTFEQPSSCPPLITGTSKPLIMSREGSDRPTSPTAYII
ncbi:hypothetical protein AB1Y20_021500 [Prymnesium parvum]|uniref:PH domain-containing protein n=1 Tax=Prymnesium parvum TaxID=97485 RepID=A0AB34JIW0_PRYPA